MASSTAPYFMSLFLLLISLYNVFIKDLFVIFLFDFKFSLLLKLICYIVTLLSVNRATCVFDRVCHVCETVYFTLYFSFVVLYTCFLVICYLLNVVG